MLVCVLAASRYDMEAEDKSKVKGAKLQIVDFSVKIAEENKSGSPVTFMDGPFELFDQLKELPGIYELGVALGQANNARGKPIATLKATSAKFVSSLFPTEKK